MTYGEASTSRTAVGSGLIYHGAPEVSHHDLNKHLSFFLTEKLYCVHIWTYFKYLFYLESGCTHWFVFCKQTWVDYSWPCLCFILIRICATLWYSWYVHKQRMTIGILFILDSSSDTFYIVLAGPDAVQFIVNHATVEVIFCVPQTLSIVSFNLCSQS